MQKNSRLAHRRNTPASLKNPRRSYAIFFALHRRINASQEATHFTGRHQRDQLNAILILDDLHSLAWADAQRITNGAWNHDLIFWRDQDSVHTNSRSICCSFYAQSLSHFVRIGNPTTKHHPNSTRTSVMSRSSASSTPF